MMKHSKTQKIVVLGIIGLMILSTASAAKIFEINFEYHKDGSANLNSIKITQGEASKFYGTGNKTKYNLTDENTAIWSEKVKYKWIETTMHTNLSTVSEMNVTVRAPYNKEAETFNIYRENKRILKVDLTENLCNLKGKCTSYCDGKNAVVQCTCGDGVCQEDPNEEQLCSQDCESPDNNGNTPVNSSDPQGNEVVNENYSIYILIGIAVLAILIILFMASGKVKIEG